MERRSKGLKLMAIPRKPGMWANGTPIAPGTRMRVDRPTLAAKKIRPTLSLTSNQDDAPPMGMARPQIPDHLKAPVYNEPDPAGGMARPQLPEHLRNLQQGK
jgi:hypothetical protein